MTYVAQIDDPITGAPVILKGDPEARLHKAILHEIDVQLGRMYSSALKALFVVIACLITLIPIVHTFSGYASWIVAICMAISIAALPPRLNPFLQSFYGFRRAFTWRNELNRLLADKKAAL